MDDTDVMCIGYVYLSSLINNAVAYFGTGQTFACEGYWLHH